MIYLFLNFSFYALASLILLSFLPPKSLLSYNLYSFLMVFIFNLLIFKVLKFELSINNILEKEPVIIILVSTLFFSFRLYQEPFGMWDSWAMWNAKTKDFTLDFIEGYEFKYFRESWAHPGYPIFIPLQQSFISINLGFFSEKISYVYNYIYLICFWYMMTNNYKLYSLSLFYRFVTFFPFLLNGLINQSSDLCADFPLSIYFCFIIYLILYHDSLNLDIKKYYNFLLGLFIGILPLIKNEGIFFLIYLVIYLALKFKNDFKFSSLSFFVIGISIPLFLNFYYKLNAPEFNPVPITKEHIINVIFIIERYKNIFYAELILNLSIFLMIPIVILYFIYKKHKISKLYLVLLCIHLTYNFIFLITSADQTWHLHTAYLRLNQQLLPAFFLITQYIIKDNIHISNHK